MYITKTSDRLTIIESCHIIVHLSSLICCWQWFFCVAHKQKEQTNKISKRTSEWLPDGATSKFADVHFVCSNPLSAWMFSTLFIQRRRINCASPKNILFHLCHRVDGWRENPYFYESKSICKKCGWPSTTSTFGDWTTRRFSEPGMSQRNCLVTSGKREAYKRISLRS